MSIGAFPLSRAGCRTLLALLALRVLGAAAGCSQPPARPTTRATDNRAPSRVASQPTVRERTIQELLTLIELSDATFIRNDREHDGPAAAAHLRGKLRQAGRQQFTADQFIEQVASRSSTSGKPYKIRLKDGKEMELGTWLRQHKTVAADEPAPPSEFGVAGGGD